MNYNKILLSIKTIQNKIINFIIRNIISLIFTLIVFTYTLLFVFLISPNISQTNNLLLSNIETLSAIISISFSISFLVIENISFKYNYNLLSIYIRDKVFWLITSVYLYVIIFNAITWATNYHIKNHVFSLPIYYTHLCLLLIIPMILNMYNLLNPHFIISHISSPLKKINLDKNLNKNQNQIIGKFFSNMSEIIRCSVENNDYRTRNICSNSINRFMRTVITSNNYDYALDQYTSTYLNNYRYYLEHNNIIAFSYIGNEIYEFILYVMTSKNYKQLNKLLRLFSDIIRCTKEKRNLQMLTNLSRWNYKIIDESFCIMPKENQIMVFKSIDDLTNNKDYEPEFFYEQIRSLISEMYHMDKIISVLDDDLWDNTSYLGFLSLSVIDKISETRVRHRLYDHIFYTIENIYKIKIEKQYRYDLGRLKSVLLSLPDKDVDDVILNIMANRISRIYLYVTDPDNYGALSLNPIRIALNILIKSKPNEIYQIINVLNSIIKLNTSRLNEIDKENPVHRERYLITINSVKEILEHTVKNTKDSKLIAMSNTLLQKVMKILDSTEGKPSYVV